MPVQAPHYRVPRADALTLLHQAITQNIVRIGGKLYRQTKGIPQVGPKALHTQAFLRLDQRHCTLRHSLGWTKGIPQVASKAFPRSDLRGRTPKALYTEGVAHQ